MFNIFFVDIKSNKTAKMVLSKKLDIHSHILPKEWPDLKQVNTGREGTLKLLITLVPKVLSKELDIHSHILPKEWPDIKQVNTGWGSRHWSAYYTSPQSFK